MTKETLLGLTAWLVRRVRDPLDVRGFRGDAELAPEDLPGMDPALRPVGSVPLE